MSEMTFTELEDNLKLSIFIAMKDGFFDGKKEIKLKPKDLFREDVRNEIMDRNIADYVEANKLTRKEADFAWYQLNKFYDIFAQTYVSRENLQAQLDRSKPFVPPVWLLVIAAIGIALFSIAWQVAIFFISMFIGLAVACSKKK